MEDNPAWRTGGRTDGRTAGICIHFFFFSCSFWLEGEEGAHYHLLNPFDFGGTGQSARPRPFFPLHSVCQFALSLFFLVSSSKYPFSCLWCGSVGGNKIGKSGGVHWCTGPAVDRTLREMESRNGRILGYRSSSTSCIPTVPNLVGVHPMMCVCPWCAIFGGRRCPSSPICTGGQPFLGEGKPGFYPEHSVW